MFLYPTVLFGVGMSQPLRSVTFGPRQRPLSFRSAQHSLPVARQASFTVVYCIPHAVLHTMLYTVDSSPFLLRYMVGMHTAFLFLYL